VTERTICGQRVSTEPFRLFCILPGQHGADRRLLAERLAVRPHVWHQEVAVPGHADGYDGAVNDYFLVRTTRFDPRGALSDDELAAEHISGMRWWRHGDIGGYRGTDLFSPRDIATPLAVLIAGDIPDTPLTLGP
jgi:hypothetical protein